MNDFYDDLCENEKSKFEEFMLAISQRASFERISEISLIEWYDYFMNGDTPDSAIKSAL